MMKLRVERLVCIVSVSLVLVLVVCVGLPFTVLGARDIRAQFVVAERREEALRQLPPTDMNLAVSADEYRRLINWSRITIRNDTDIIVGLQVGLCILSLLLLHSWKKVTRRGQEACQ